MGRIPAGAYHRGMARDDGFDHDILILGGGLVGSALACALASTSASWRWPRPA